jgi:cell division protein FtsW
MSRKLTWDRKMFAVAATIMIGGVAMIYSSSAIIAAQKSGDDNPFYFVVKQCAFLAVGAVLMLAVMHLDIHLLRDPRLVYSLLGAIVMALVLVLFQPPINGTHRWFALPFFNVQPAELAKPVLILFMATYLAQKEERINELSSTLLPLAGVLAIVAGLILVQPDFGTAATILAVAAAMIFAAGLAWTKIAAFALTLVPILALVLLSADYRRDRLLTFLNPEADPLGKGFQALQSLIALGTGGVTGLGLGNGRQKLFFLPEPHTDFIFSIIGEELGFIGATALLLLFAVLVWRGFVVARNSTDRFAFYAALGFTLLIGIQVLVNVSVTLCLLPTKGLPLPFVSYGGSSLLASMLSLGILLNLSQQSN